MVRRTNRRKGTSRKVEAALRRFEARFKASEDESDEPAVEPAASALVPVVPFVPKARPPALPVPLALPAAPLLEVTAPTSEPWVSPERSRRIEPGDLHQPVRPVFFTPTGLVYGPPQYVQWSGEKEDEQARRRLQPHLHSAFAKAPTVHVMLPIPESPVRRIGRWLHERFR